jgi:hypothetical protein
MFSELVQKNYRIFYSRFFISGKVYFHRMDVKLTIFELRELFSVCSENFPYEMCVRFFSDK